MSATVAADFVFEPKVWSDHIMAYFDRKLVFGAFALRDDTLTAEPGLTQNFPYFKKIGDAEEPAEDSGLVVDNLEDDSFSCTVKEVSKAVGFTKKSLKKSAASKERIMTEAQEQLGRIMAEKVDKDLLTEIIADANSVNSSVAGGGAAAFEAAAAGDIMTVRSLNTGKIKGFGDKHADSVVVFMHSLQFLDLMNDSTAGFLKADANDPMFMVQGFEGRLLGMAIVTVDSMPKNVGGQVGGKDTYDAYIHKMNSYGFLSKQDVEIERDYDILHRQWVMAADQWYGVKSFHAKIASDYKKAARIRTTVS